MRLIRCKDGPRNGKVVTLQQWYYDHVARVRQFVADHPSHALVEIDIENNKDTGVRMAQIFDGDLSFWVSSFDSRLQN